MLHLWTTLAPTRSTRSSWSWPSKKPSKSKFPTKTPRRSAPCRTRSATSTRTPRPRSNGASDGLSACSCGWYSPEASNAFASGGAKGDSDLMASVDERVKQIIVEQLGVDEAEVTPNASFVDDLGADSLDTVELVMAFEEAFEIEIPDEDAEKIRTVKDAVDYINAHAKTKK